MDLQLLVFDSRRGNTEGREDDKVLAGFPSGLPLVQQSGLAGLLQGLLLFTANFTAPQVAGCCADGGASILQIVLSVSFDANWHAEMLCKVWLECLALHLNVS
jgi:hypothetical protein